MDIQPSLIGPAMVFPCQSQVQFGRHCSIDLTLLKTSFYEGLNGPNKLIGASNR